MTNPRINPPRFSERIIRSLFPDEGHYSTLGDIEEVFQHIVETEGPVRARRWYRVQALRSLIPAFRNSLYWRWTMIKSYLVSAFRHLKRNRVYSAINVFGLAVAVGFAILAFLFVRSELSHDQFHPNHEDIYRVGTTVNFQAIEHWENTPHPLTAAIRNEVAGVSMAASLTRVSQQTVRIAGTTAEYDLHLASADFFKLLRFPTLLGGHESLTSNPSAVLISKSVWMQFFAGQDPIGERIVVSANSTDLELTVAGVLAPSPENSSISFDFVLSDSNIPAFFGPSIETDWFPKSATTTFFSLAPGADIEAVQLSLDAIARSNGMERYLRGAEVDHLFTAERLDKAHFSKLIENRILSPNGDILYSYTLGGIALLVLIIACINFMNLSVGLSAGRSREVGVRKVLGAERGQLAYQFWMESLLLCGVATLIGLVLAFLLLPTFNNLAGKQLVLDLLTNPSTAVGLLILLVFVGLAAGAYPALVLSSFRPMAVLKGRLKLTGRGHLSRVMMTFQFAVSMFLITSALVMARQLNYLTTLDVGYDSELLVFQDLPKGVDESVVQRFRNAVGQSTDVVGVTAARTTLFGDAIGSAFMIERDGEPYTLPTGKIDFEFLDVLGIPLVSGRNLSPDHPSDVTDAVLVNEAFVEEFGMESPLGQRAPFGGENDPIIVGVVADFHFQSLRSRIGPLVLNLRPDSDYRQVVTRIRGTDVASTLARLERTWNDLDTGSLFNYTFVDEAIQRQYVTEQNFRTISSFSAWIATLIACLGLFGMASLSVARRTKEMGIRKVLGASAARIVFLFNREYIVLIVVAIGIAAPVSWYLMGNWIQRFAYPVELGFGLFALAAVAVIAIAVVTISLQARGAAGRNPVETLRYE